MKRSDAVRNRSWGVVTLILGLVVCIAAVLIACGFQGCSGGSSSPSSTTSSSSTANQRHLVYQNGKPFPILGRTAWFITSLSEPDYRMFIDDTVAKGFNAIEFHVVNHDPDGNNPPFGANGTLLPFRTQLDGSPWAGKIYSYSSMN